MSSRLAQEDANRNNTEQLALLHQQVSRLEIPSESGQSRRRHCGKYNQQSLMLGTQQLMVKRCSTCCCSTTSGSRSCISSPRINHSSMKCICIYRPADWSVFTPHAPTAHPASPATSVIIPPPSVAASTDAANTADLDAHQ